MSQRAWSSSAIAHIAGVVRDRTGLVFSDPRRDVAEGTIRRAMDRVGLRDPERYAALLAEGGAALDDLVAELTVGETYFFRESAQLDFIRRTVIPDVLRSHAPRQALRVWSAGCASGEEPYTIAIMLREMELADRARILGTEISRPRLAAARQGRYGEWSMRGVPRDIVERWFTHRDRRYQLDPAIRRMVEFRYLNLAEDTYPASSTGIWGMDIILCRNVLIYFDRETVTRVATRLLRSLSDNGWLILGASDPMLTELVHCQAVVTGAGLAYRRGDAIVAVAQPAPASLVRQPPPPALVPEPEAPLRVEPRAPLSPPPAALAGTSPGDAYDARDYAAAEELAREAIAAAKGDERCWVVLVRSLANTGRLDEAGRACASALDRYRGSAELAYLHSLLLAESGRYGDAAAAARRALYLDRNLVVGYLALGAALTRIGDARGARRAFANAEDLLQALPPDELVPASDGERAIRLLHIVRAQASLLSGDAA